MATEREGNYDEFPAAASEVETEVRDDFMALGVAKKISTSTRNFHITVYS